MQSNTSLEWIYISIDMKKREMALICAVARTGSVTASAAAVGMSQPAASALLRQLEERVGLALFSRRRRRLELTADGRTLLPEITHALAALESVERMSQSMGRSRQRRWVIGAVAAAGASVLPGALQPLLAQQPDVTVVLRSGTAVEIVDMAVQQRIDLGLIYGSARHEQVTVEHLAALDLVCVMPAQHPYAALAAVSVAQLAAMPYIAHSRFLPVGALTAQALEAAGHGFKPALEVMQFSAACAMAEAGSGVAVLESLAAQYAQRHGLVARPLLAPSDLSLTAVWSPEKGLGSLPRQLLDALKLQLRETH